METGNCETHRGTGFRQSKTNSMGRGAASDHRPPQWPLSLWIFTRPHSRNLSLPSVGTWNKTKPPPISLSKRFIFGHGAASAPEPATLYPPRDRNPWIRFLPFADEQTQGASRATRAGQSSAPRPPSGHTFDPRSRDDQSSETAPGSDSAIR